MRIHTLTVWILLGLGVSLLSLGCTWAGGEPPAAAGWELWTPARRQVWRFYGGPSTARIDQATLMYAAQTHYRYGADLSVTRITFAGGHMPPLFPQEWAESGETRWAWVRLRWQGTAAHPGVTRVLTTRPSCSGVGRQMLCTQVIDASSLAYLLAWPQDHSYWLYKLHVTGVSTPQTIHADWRRWVKSCLPPQVLTAAAAEVPDQVCPLPPAVEAG